MFTKYSIIVRVLLPGLIVACGGDNPAGPSSSDRQKFVGNWAGSYACSFPDPADTLMIALGSGDLDFKITLHASVFNIAPDIVDGNLTASDVISIPNQIIGGADGSGEIKYSNGRLSLSQSGLGITCNGSNYIKY